MSAIGAAFRKRCVSDSAQGMSEVERLQQSNVQLEAKLEASRQRNNEIKAELDTERSKVLALQQELDSLKERTEEEEEDRLKKGWKKKKNVVKTARKLREAEHVERICKWYLSEVERHKNMKPSKNFTLREAAAVWRKEHRYEQGKMNPRQVNYQSLGKWIKFYKDKRLKNYGKVSVRDCGKPDDLGGEVFDSDTETTTVEVIRAMYGTKEDFTLHWFLPDKEDDEGDEILGRWLRALWPTGGVSNHSGLPVGSTPLCVDRGVEEAFIAKEEVVHRTYLTKHPKDDNFSSEWYCLPKEVNDGGKATSVLKNKKKGSPEKKETPIDTLADLLVLTDAPVQIVEVFAVRFGMEPNLSLHWFLPDDSDDDEEDLPDNEVNDGADGCDRKIDYYPGRWLKTAWPIGAIPRTNGLPVGSTPLCVDETCDSQGIDPDEVLHRTYVTKHPKDDNFPSEWYCLPKAEQEAGKKCFAALSANRPVPRQVSRHHVPDLSAEIEEFMEKEELEMSGGQPAVSPPFVACAAQQQEGDGEVTTTWTERKDHEIKFLRQALRAEKSQASHQKALISMMDVTQSVTFHTQLSHADHSGSAVVLGLKSEIEMLNAKVTELDRSRVLPFPPEDGLLLCYGACGINEKSIDPYWALECLSHLYQAALNPGLLSTTDFLLSVNYEVRKFENLENRKPMAVMSSNRNVIDEPIPLPLWSRGKTRVLLVGPQYNKSTTTTSSSGLEVEELSGDVLLDVYKKFFQQALKVPGTDITVLCDNEPCDGPATKLGMQQGMQTVMKLSRPGDTVMVLFSCHSNPDWRQRKKTGDYALQPSDYSEAGDLSRSDFQRLMDPENFGVSGVNVISFIDTCHCGNILDLEFTTATTGHRSLGQKFHAEVGTKFLEVEEGRLNKRRRT